ncbi:siderophore-iron reductase FhuF [Halomonas campisalis]|uniref:Siderophore-iron reductase FhuF n=1 Tax=Billgrantia campisalis TaxID=74661 RepID=A0ABS9P7Q1_9GAMM|nr:siderophore-iron reductase FhuF [Halomonas campisalis]MCG6657774.1 siderophore-iron reductase FhuF [Halomonas campisalis]MDR5862454.1 siderophore-iron reductase FhuF [Halomonas campisalis]
MNQVLPPLYTGPLEGLSPPKVATAPAADAAPARDLLDPDHLDALLERFGARYDHGDRRAVASLWSKWHFSALIAHGLAANLLLERDLPLGLDELHLVQSPEGQTTGLVLRHVGRPLAGLDPHARFATLLDDHLTPLVEALAATTGASAKVFWSNAGNYFEHFAGALANHPMAAPDVAEPARALMESRTLPDGRRNPLYHPVRYVEGEGDGTRRVRRLCCIRYLIDELGVCGNCPLRRDDRQR